MNSYFNISVIIPTFNRKHTLNRAINSVLNQTLKPDKILINIPYKYNRFTETIPDNQIPNFDSDIIKSEINSDPASVAFKTAEFAKKNEL